MSKRPSRARCRVSRADGVGILGESGHMSTEFSFKSNVDLPAIDVEVTPKKRATKKKESNSQLVPPDTLFCMACGVTYKMTMPAPISIMCATIDAFDKDHKRCKIDKAKGPACSHCFGFGHAEDGCSRLDYRGSVEKWWNGPDTGASSKAICAKLAGWTHEQRASTPLDPSDFGRCHRLLKAIPGWRARIGEMADVPGWAGLVEAWDELEALYEEELPSGNAPKLYARMREIEQVSR